MFYVYEWYNVLTGFIFYVGKGTGKRYLNVKSRNKLFIDYLSTNENCLSRIIKTFTDEIEALAFEHKRITELKNVGQCVCNLDNGGTGGTSFVWTEEMRAYKSLFNPMKDETQRKRMSKFNPMKDTKVSCKVAEKKSRSVIIKGIKFDSTKSAGEYFNRCPEQIQTWCKRGYDSDKIPCRYNDEKQKEFVLKVTNSVKVIVDGKEFNSVKEASEYIEVWPETLIRAIKNNRLCKGHTCKYGNQQPSPEKSN